MSRFYGLTKQSEENKDIDGIHLVICVFGSFSGLNIEVLLLQCTKRFGCMIRKANAL